MICIYPGGFEYSLIFTFYKKAQMIKAPGKKIPGAFTIAKKVTLLLLNACDYYKFPIHYQIIANLFHIIYFPKVRVCGSVKVGNL